LFVGVEGSDYPPERFVAGPYGLGVRVPMIVISPWSKGGWVNSQVFDHTSLIRFLERRFGVMEPNITAWRRAITGDLTSAFDFASPNAAVVALPDTSSFQPSNLNRHPDYVPKPPANQALPQQEPGTRPARALPYELLADAQVNASGVQVSFRNTGKAGVVFHVRSGDGLTGPWTYTVGAGDATSDNFAASGGKYDLSVYGPNGFLRSFAGSVGGSTNVAINTIYDRQSGGIALVLQNRGSSAVNVSVFDAYSGQTQARLLQPQQSVTFASTLQASFGWYDFTVTVNSDPGFRRQLAGHVETGRASMSDPAMGG
jgi:phospholipase C